MKHEIINKIKEFLHTTLSPTKDVEVSEGDELLSKNKDKKQTVWFRVYVDNDRFYSKNDSEALFAVNHLAKRIAEKLSTEENPENMLDILVDINDLQKQRIESIRNQAHMMAERARYFKSTIEFEPMSAFERRVIHEFLADEVDLKTESEGFGRDRKVVIKYIA